MFTSTPSDPTFRSQAGSSAETLSGSVRRVRPAERVQRAAGPGTSEGNLRRAAKGAEMMGLLVGRKWGYN